MIAIWLICPFVAPVALYLLYGTFWLQNGYMDMLVGFSRSYVIPGLEGGAVGIALGSTATWFFGKSMAGSAKIALLCLFAICILWIPSMHYFDVGQLLATDDFDLLDMHLVCMAGASAAASALLAVDRTIDSR